MSTGTSRVDLAEYRQQPAETSRVRDLMNLIPRNRVSVLDIGARDGYLSKLLTAYFSSVTALDLEMPRFEAAGVVKVRGDVTRLDFPDNSFDVILCAEVLEHVPALERACSEIVRVARHEVLIGVPFRQDTRVGRTTCGHCGGINPPWGHVNTFDEERLERLFRALVPMRKSFAGTRTERTSALAVWLMDRGGNPWGVYNQEERCVHCGAQLTPPGAQGFVQRACSGLAARLNKIQGAFLSPRPAWIHMLFRKRQPL